jgi:hypothetical protein
MSLTEVVAGHHHLPPNRVDGVGGHIEGGQGAMERDLRTLVSEADERCLARSGLLCNSVYPSNNVRGSISLAMTAVRLEEDEQPVGSQEKKIEATVA